MLAYQTQTAAAAVANGTFAATFALTPWGAAALAIAGIAGGMVLLAQELNKAKIANENWSTSFDKLKEEAKENPFRSLTASTLGYGIALQGAIDKQNTLAAGPKKGGGSSFIPSNYGVGAGVNAKGKINAIGRADLTPEQKFQKDLEDLLAGMEASANNIADAGKNSGAAAGKTFFEGINEGILKEKTKAKLGKLGLSKDFITAILGASDWEATAKKLGKSTAGALAQVQANWYKTAEGIAAHDAAVKAAEAEYEKLKDEFEAWEKNVKSLNEALADNKKQFQALGKAAKDIGAFEQEVVSAFENIESTIKQALDVKLITDASAGILREFAKTKMKALTDNAAERDALRQKREDAQALFKDVKSSILNLGNITSEVDKKTAQVSTTVTKIVDGITVATTRTVEEVIGGSTIIDRFKETIENSKKFAAQLNELRQLGLNSNLFNQIVEAGVEAGSATATEIITGGADAVAELNGLFAQLDSVGTSVAEQTTAVMFNNGQMIAGGIVEGLLAQEETLAATAVTLADAFITAFNAQMAQFQVSMTPPISNVPSIPEVFIPEKQDKIAKQKDKAVPAITLNVNAGVGTNGTKVGQQIVREVNKALKNGTASTLFGTGRLGADYI